MSEFNFEYSSKRKAIPENLRETIIKSIEDGFYSRKAAASAFKVSYSTVTKIYKDFLDCEDINESKNELKKDSTAEKQIDFNTTCEEKNENIITEPSVVPLEWLASVNEENKSFLHKESTETCTPTIAKPNGLSEEPVQLKNSDEEYIQFMRRKLAKYSNYTIEDSPKVTLNDNRKKQKILLEEPLPLNSSEEKNYHKEKSLEANTSNEYYTLLVQRRLAEYHNYIMKESKAVIGEKSDKKCKQMPTEKSKLSTVDHKSESQVLPATTSKGIAVFQYNLQRIQRVALPAITAEEIMKRRVYCENFLNITSSDRTIVYFDESRYNVTMKRSNEPNCPEFTVPSRTKTVMISMTKCELLCYKVIDGPRTNSHLIEYINDLLLVLEQRNITGAAIIADEDIYQNCQHIKAFIEQQGHQSAVLMVNCPFLNPIDNIFSQFIKHIHSVDSKNELVLEDLINMFPGTINEEQCHNYCQLVTDNVSSCLMDNLVYDG